jgi:hypothetical protein
VGKQTDHVDILFANAGATWGQYFDEVEEKKGWDRVMDLNVKGVFFTIQKYVLWSLHLCLEVLETWSQVQLKFNENTLIMETGSLPFSKRTQPSPHPLA